MKALEFSPEVLQNLQQFKRKNPVLYKRIRKQLELFQNNPRHRSLRLHKIKRDRKSVWSISINDSLRMLYLDETKFYFFDIGTHDEVYRKK